MDYLKKEHRIYCRYIKTDRWWRYARNHIETINFPNECELTSVWLFIPFLCGYVAFSLSNAIKHRKVLVYLLVCCFIRIIVTKIVYSAIFFSAELLVIFALSVFDTKSYEFFCLKFLVTIPNAIRECLSIFHSSKML